MTEGRPRTLTESESAEIRARFFRADSARAVDRLVRAERARDLCDELIAGAAAERNAAAIARLAEMRVLMRYELAEAIRMAVDDGCVPAGHPTGAMFLGHGLAQEEVLAWTR